MISHSDLVAWAVLYINPPKRHVPRLVWLNTCVLRVSSGAVFSPRTPDLQYLGNSEHRYVTALATYFSQGAKVQIEIKIIKLIDTIVEKNTAGCIFIPSIGSGLKADDDCCA